MSVENDPIRGMRRSSKTRRSFGIKFIKKKSDQVGTGSEQNSQWDAGRRSKINLMRLNKFKCDKNGIRASKKGCNVIFIFFCEFSSERGPKMYNFFRNHDRSVNKYPNLHYPQSYVMRGGFSQFHENFKFFCRVKGQEKAPGRAQMQMHVRNEERPKQEARVERKQKPRAKKRVEARRAKKPKQPEKVAKKPKRVKIQMKPAKAKAKAKKAAKQPRPKMQLQNFRIGNSMCLVRKPAQFPGMMVNFRGKNFNGMQRLGQRLSMMRPIPNREMMRHGRAAKTVRMKPVELKKMRPKKPKKKIQVMQVRLDAKLRRQPKKPVVVVKKKKPKKPKKEKKVKKKKKSERNKQETRKRDRKRKSRSQDPGRFQMESSRLDESELKDYQFSAAKSRECSQSVVEINIEKEVIRSSRGSVDAENSSRYRRMDDPKFRNEYSKEKISSRIFWRNLNENASARSGQRAYSIK